MRVMVETLRKILPYTTILCVIVAIYTGWVMYSRWESGREAERAIQQKKAEDAKRLTDAYGSGMKILGFYASPPSIDPGEKTKLCYSVSSAKTVTIEPV